MKYNTSLFNDKEKQLFNELKNEFNFIEDNSGLKVKFIDGKDYKISKSNNELTVTVNKTVQKAHALGYIQTLELENFDEYTFNVKFEDLTYMADCSRNAVIKVDVVKKFLRHIAYLGYTSYGLYIEDTYEVEEEAYFGYLRSKYSKKDLKEINDYGLMLGIEVVPYIQTLAHLNCMLRWGEYFPITDCHDILLVGDQRTYLLLDRMLKTVSECFTTKRINIGMDEAHFLGKGNYLNKNGYKERYDIMKEHLGVLTPMLNKYNFEPMMWSDMYFRFVCGGEYYDGNGKLDTNIAKDIPQNMKLVYWDYYHLDNTYDQMLKKHQAFDREIVFAGGAWKWIGFTPDNKYSIEASKKALKACVKYNVKEVVITGWGDNGAECSTFAILPALYYNSTFTYSLDKEKNYKTNFEVFAGLDYDSFMNIDLANKLSAKPKVEEKNSANKNLLYNDLLLGTLDTIVEEGFNKLYTSHSNKLNKVVKKQSKWTYLFVTQYALTKVLSVKAELGVNLRTAYQNKELELLEKYKKDCIKLNTLLNKFHDYMYVQWNEENRANGFDVLDLRMGGLQQRVKYTIRKLDDYLSNKIDVIEELEETLLDYHGGFDKYHKAKDICDLRWAANTSVNVNN